MARNIVCRLLITLTVVAIATRPIGALAADCNENGIDDACDLDCGSPGGPCDVTGCGASPDCNANSIPDECDVEQCPPIDIVFLFDTSTSNDELDNLCAAVDTVVGNLAAGGYEVIEERLAIFDGGVQCNCCEAGFVQDIYTLQIEEAYRDVLPEVLGDCDDDVQRLEDWGTGTAVVAAMKAEDADPIPDNPWGPGPRIIIPISDEGPRCGDPINTNDQDVIDHAIPIVAENRVIVAPVVDTANGGLLALAQQLADGGEPCGRAFRQQRLWFMRGRSMIQRFTGEGEKP